MAASHGHWLPAYVGLGSNLDDPPAQVRRALTALAGLPQTRLIAASRRYRNPPFGDTGQPDYVNAVAALLTTLTPLALLGELKAVEARHGRQRVAGDRWASRTLDLDLLVYADRVMREPGLTLPHPGIEGRNFVLLPLLEIAPGLRIEGLGRIGQLAGAVDATPLVPLD